MRAAENSRRLAVLHLHDPGSAFSAPSFAHNSFSGPGIFGVEKERLLAVTRVDGCLKPRRNFLESDPRLIGPYAPNWPGDYSFNCRRLLGRFDDRDDAPNERGCAS